ncbi:hypothetical protein [Lentiprolixibacter aurantiacus]|uniref:Uncharacterized protein n=1 Tax=Lentiprolixibacter aurantiacus TaxID=2993939 RepID=A0AAE3MKT0_9FLAO|nr:hypothetical protein [Lentiprolixibacter aurantiacus]MCX2719151.1 hypothetical protein [Lentiprolixibacter aurantiacus]
MAPDKFEKYIKEKMQQREITPSEEAWSKIAGQLPQEEKRRKPVIWYSIAASFVGIVILGLYLSRSPKPDLDSPVQIVATEVQEADKDSEAEEVPSGNKWPETEQTETLAETMPAQEAAEKEGQSQLKAIPNSMEQELAVLESSEFVKDESMPVGEINNTEELIIEAKITEVIAEVRLLELNSDALTEAEVDSLLRNAQDELLREKIFKTDRNVDAMALLNEVENELDRSFRDQIFDRLKSGFNKVRTAVADRNN